MLVFRAAMDLARKYARIIKSQLLHHAAWSPVTDAFEVGDYGVIRRGVFQRLGNVREFGVEPAARTSASSVSLDFTSTGTTMVRTTAGAKVAAFPTRADVQGELQIGFEADGSVFIRTGRLTVSELTAVGSTATQLLRKRDRIGRKWKLGWRIIRKLYTAEDPVILAASERGARIALRGRADALGRFEAGKGTVGLTVSSKTTASLQILGGRGPVAFDLFKVRLRDRVGLGLELPPAGEPECEPELDDEWPDELDDDPDELCEPGARAQR